MSAPTHADRHGTAGNPAVDPDSLEVAPGTARESFEGWIPDLATEDELRSALEKAFDYRGDVTVTRKNGNRVEGYIFDRVSGPDLHTSFIRLLSKDSSEKIRISYADIAALAFSSRDPAAGKSWEAWVRKYWERKAAGADTPSLQPDSLD